VSGFSTQQDTQSQELVLEKSHNFLFKIGSPFPVGEQIPNL